MTADYIAFHATSRPDAVALVDRGRAINFATFDRDLRNLIPAVSALGVPKGGSVAVGCDDLYTHWLLLLAFEELGIAAVSFYSFEGEGASFTLGGVDLVLTEPHFVALAGFRQHAITREWLSQSLSRDAGLPDDRHSARSPEDPVRILRTSGTTGSPKRLVHPRSLHEAWVARWIVMAGIDRRSRLLLTMPFTVNGMYACATACLRAGGTVFNEVMPAARDIARAIVAHAITTLILAPFQIEQLLNALPDGFVKPASFTLCSFGAAVSGTLRGRALQMIATEHIDMYGSNEAGFIASTWAAGNDEGSTIWPGARVEIVDDGDRPLPDGEAGRIRVRTPDMVQGYLGNAEATRQMFRDGWFYPGDLGIRRGARGLLILGRGDSLLNFGGRKHPAEVLERAILKAVTLRDVAVCSAPNADGIEEILIGMVGAPNEDRALLERLRDALKPFRAGNFRAARLPEIPRNPNGKIQRDVLRRAILDALSSSPVVTS
ncbi:MAG TPA: long-chain fatty acid--CoA ligase [Stellaceae bacterium]|nr:long-chain fatty acid--CoA ligase [Stellaceae bacterium]